MTLISVTMRPRVVREVAGARSALAFGRPRGCQSPRQRNRVPLPSQLQLDSARIPLGARTPAAITHRFTFSA